MEVFPEVGEEVEVWVIRNSFIDPQYSFYTEISDIMLELFTIPLLLLGQQLSGKKSISQSSKSYLDNKYCTWLPAKVVKKG
jgi:hypothetical protein